jgi:hypothetical protein
LAGAVAGEVCGGRLRLGRTRMYRGLGSGRTFLMITSQHLFSLHVTKRAAFRSPGQMSKDKKEGRVGPILYTRLETSNDHLNTFTSPKKT